MTTQILIDIDFDEDTDTGQITVKGTNLSEDLALAAAAHGLAMETGCDIDTATQTLDALGIELEPHQAKIGFQL